MILSDVSILEEIKKKSIILNPFYEECVQPSSVDLHLGKEFLIFNNHKASLIDTRKGAKELMEKVGVGKDQPLVVHPREFVLGTTEEWVEVPDFLVGRLEGKSSLGRIGLVIHSTAGYVDPGFKGQLTLEISNLANLPIALYPGMRICQISFLKMTTPAKYPYGHKRLVSHYQDQKGVMGSSLGSVWGKK